MRKYLWGERSAVSVPWGPASDLWFHQSIDYTNQTATLGIGATGNHANLMHRWPERQLAPQPVGIVATFLTAAEHTFVLAEEQCTAARLKSEGRKWC